MVGDRQGVRVLCGRCDGGLAHFSYNCALYQRRAASHLRRMKLPILPNLPPALRRWPLPLLLVSLALTAVAAVDAHRAVVSQRVMATRALREFASFAGWSYGQHL